jgi:hypothetical protein
MTSEGRPYARFQRAIRTGNAWIAEQAPRDLPGLGLEDALELCLLYRRGDPERYERAAARWIRRLVAERPGARLSEVELAAAGFRDALHDERGVSVLRQIAGGAAASPRPQAGSASSPDS